VWEKYEQNKEKYGSQRKSGPNLYEKLRKCNNPN